MFFSEMNSDSLHFFPSEMNSESESLTVSISILRSPVVFHLGYSLSLSWRITPCGSKVSQNNVSEKCPRKFPIKSVPKVSQKVYRKSEPEKKKCQKFAIPSQKSVAKKVANLFLILWAIGATQSQLKDQTHNHYQAYLMEILYKTSLQRFHN